MDDTAVTTHPGPEIQGKAQLPSGVKKKKTISTERISPVASLVLDVVRFVAALTVALGHFSEPIFSSGIRSFMNAGAGAVGVFFVLSGFVIRYITQVRPSDLPDYLVDRLARLQSVVLPGICLSVVAELVFRHYQPGDPVQTPGGVVVRMLTMVTFTSEVWFQHLPQGMDGPFWSLSYEAFYYVLYGFGFYLTGPKRVIAVCVAALLAGPAIVFYAPLWFFGCFLHDLYQRTHRSRRQSILAVATLVTGGVVALGVVLALPHADRSALRAWNRGLSSQLDRWHFQMAASTWYYETGIVAGLALLGALLVMQRIPLHPRSRTVRLVRYVADGTFPLYLFHLPLFYMVRDIVPYARNSKPQLAAVFLSVVTVSILLGGPCNRLKDLIRRGFAPLIQSRLRSPVPAS